MKTLIKIEGNYYYYKMGTRFIEHIEKKKGSMSLKTQGKS